MRGTVPGSFVVIAPQPIVGARARLVGAWLAVLALLPTTGFASEALRFSRSEGAALNEFYRRGSVAAHLIVSTDFAPRVVVAFPAGNSGAALWFERAQARVSVQSGIEIEPVVMEIETKTLRGIAAEMSLTGGPLMLRQAMAGSVRVIRDYDDGRPVPSDVLVSPQLTANTASWQRARLDGKGAYRISLEALEGTLDVDRSGRIRITPGGERLRLRFTALTADAPLTPMTSERLLTTAAAPDERLRQNLAFLSYEEKLLAGSWRFNTYFGRDTLMSLRLLAPVLQPPMFEAGLGSVLERLRSDGDVAHEEEIGEFAVLQRLRAGLSASDAPLYDYKMIDDDLMLAPVAAHYLLDTAGGRARGSAFLAKRTSHGDTQGARLVRNLRFVLDRSAAFAREPAWRHLIALKEGEQAGNWRDSEDGLGGGRYPYDVNGVLAPAALSAIARLHRSGVLAPYLDADAGRELSRAGAMAGIWLRSAPPLFDVTVSPATARSAIREYSKRIRVDAGAALAALDSEPVRFHAVALDRHGAPVPVVSSDEGFALLFLEPPPAELERMVRSISRPFPAGLMTPIGLLVANPTYAPRDLQPRFARGRYHGTVVWSWQQALLAAGLERQLARRDLTASARAALESARMRLGDAMAAAEEVRGSELWSWSNAGGRYRLEPFGQRQEDETESNAAQLWSTVHLARPAR